MFSWVDSTTWAASICGQCSCDSIYLCRTKQQWYQSEKSSSKTPLPSPFTPSLSAVPPRLLSGIIYSPTRLATSNSPSPSPTVPRLGTGLSSEVTLTLARALPFNPISQDRYWQPACSNRYGRKVVFFTLYIHLINILSLSKESQKKKRREINTFILTSLFCIRAVTQSQDTVLILVFQSC